MLNYLIRRVLIGCVTLLVITFLVYGLIRNMPGSPLTVAVTELDPSKKINPEDLQADAENLWPRQALVRRPISSGWGTRPAWIQAARFTHKKPVLEVIEKRIGPTLALSITSISLAYLIVDSFGPAWRQSVAGHKDERGMSLLLYALYSFPTFVTALLLQIAFAVRKGWLPLLGMESADFDQLSTWEKIWDLFKHALMPVICETYGSLAYYSRFVRSNMAEVVKQDYIRTARAKGVGPVRVIFHHAFRNTLIPFVTMLGLSLPVLLSGAVIIEQIFSWPGMGLLFFESILGRDYPTIMGLTLVFSILTLLGTLLADVMYAVVDPRISYS